MNVLAARELLNNEGKQTNSASTEDKVSKNMVEKYDADGSGALGKEEIISMFKGFDKDGSGGLNQAEIRDLVKGLTGDCPDENAEASEEKSKLMNDVMNTGISAALIGGFALGNIQHDDRISGKWMDVTFYMLSFIAVHACTCSCLTSAMMYRGANLLKDDEVVSWTERNWLLMKLPWMKFVFGCSCYIISVIILSFRALENLPFFRWASLVIGTMSMSTVVFTFVCLARDSGPLKDHPTKTVGGPKNYTGTSEPPARVAKVVQVAPAGNLAGTAF
jgi:hypothetical protein